MKHMRRMYIYCGICWLRSSAFKGSQLLAGGSDLLRVTERSSVHDNGGVEHGLGLSLGTSGDQCGPERMNGSGGIWVVALHLSSHLDGDAESLQPELDVLLRQCLGQTHVGKRSQLVRPLEHCATHARRLKQMGHCCLALAAGRETSAELHQCASKGRVVAAVVVPPSRGGLLQQRQRCRVICEVLGVEEAELFQRIGVQLCLL
mmetsp:Transcript_7239/g.30809  ORF Transcript_7239/g.30809 Transcript_7239/m.30809 type:complete len:204 (-) Transcript_7239:2471-3082(-)